MGLALYVVKTFGIQEALVARRATQLEITATLPIKETQGLLNHAAFAVVNSLAAVRFGASFSIRFPRSRKLLLTT